ncbi:hypothetical protein [Capnocytophaga gingivalis]|uniref:hypothetical protein n=1 Tax=Capnocytophaga gingivalis TaxID=1017 RepID=UPI0028EA338C|nr:hypothetical protein [Capnocytophaga gingivalis]
MILIDITKANIIEARDYHIKCLTPKILESVSDSNNLEIKSFLTEEKIKCILGGSPKKIYQLNLLFLRKTIDNFRFKDWEAYNDITKINQPEEKRRLRNIFDNVYNEIEKIFSYKNFTTKKKKEYDTYDLAENLDIPTCPYCNRMYTKTVKGKAGKKIIRPEFDHWFPKSEYPLLALSFYNLIPSCHICNSNVKGKTEFKLDTHFHPYNSASNVKATFSYNYKSCDGYRIKINTKDDFSRDSVEAFQLENIYQAHEDEVKDLIKIRQAYSDKYIEILKNSLKGLSLSKEEVYRLAFGVHYEEDKFDRRPLSKLKKDILTELGII